MGLKGDFRQWEHLLGVGTSQWRIGMHRVICTTSAATSSSQRGLVEDPDRKDLVPEHWDLALPEQEPY